MDRRDYLARLAGVAGVGLAGCVTLPGSRVTGDDLPSVRNATTSNTSSPRPDGRLPRRGEVTLPVSRREMRSPLTRDHIPAIVDPVFGDDWDGLSLPDDSRAESTTLPGDAPVIGLTDGDRARAYPLRILDWHEIVNDTFGGPIAVTYCVLCGSSVVVDRVVGGSTTTFGVSGYLWRSDLVLYDRATESLWSQLLATAINGPLTGTELTIRPSSLTTWGAWSAEHPETDVLLPPPQSNTIRGREATFDYFIPKYRRDSPSVIGFGTGSDGLHPRSLVLGVAHGDAARAYPFETVRREGVVNDDVGGLPVVVTVAPGNTLVAYERRGERQTLHFSADGPSRFSAGATRWQRSTGAGVSGPQATRDLTRANDHPPMFWLGWSGFYPETSVYGEDAN
ncbi:hypothetical protein C455_11773 [Haloferax larsenii JCM 13917]|nr:DUF3179 domain-containing protein [Haloferax larsenii]ELZ78360.1 hypothetical protein C455_11773 [Haloferax larsenii JCM 13917]